MSESGKKTMIKKWKVVCDDLKIIINGKIHILPADRIERIHIDKSYDVKFLPIIKLTLNIENELMHQIKFNYQDTLFNLAIYSSIFDDETSEITYKQNWINGQFIYIPENVTPDINKELNSVDKEDTTPSSENTLTKMDVVLFDIKMLTEYRKLYNNIFVGATATNAIGAIITNYGIPTLMSPIANSKAASQVIIKPSNLLKCIDVIHNHIGLYPTGYRAFRDFDVLYLLDNSGKCNAFRPNEYKDIFINIADSSQSDSLVYGMVTDAKTKTASINVATDNVSIKALAPMMNELGFSKIQTISDADKKLTAEVSLDSVTKAKHTKYLHNQYDNSIIMQSMLNKMKENSYFLSTIFYDIDARVFTPNKAYNIRFSDGTMHKKYGGAYKISRNVIMISSKDGSMEANVYAEFKKI